MYVYLERCWFNCCFFYGAVKLCDTVFDTVFDILSTQFITEFINEDGFFFSRKIIDTPLCIVQYSSTVQQQPQTTTSKMTLKLNHHQYVKDFRKAELYNL